jgi:hypothetical protein
MKKLLRHSFCLLVLITNQHLNAQSILKPEFTMKPYYIVNDSTLQKPEQAEANLISSSSIKMTQTNSYVVNTPKSKLRFGKKSLPIFVIQLDASQDPEELISVIKGEQTKRSRIFPVWSSNNKKENINFVPLTFIKIGPGLYEVHLPYNISIGEYVILFNHMGTMSATNQWIINCFGIDF